VLLTNLHPNIVLLDADYSGKMLLFRYSNLEQTCFLDLTDETARTTGDSSDSSFYFAFHFSKAAWNYYENNYNTSDSFSKQEQESWNAQKKGSSDKK
jgi:hypothetical protein